MRWTHPERGFISPERVISMAEQTGLIHPLTVWVLNKALQQVAQWSQQNISLCNVK
ncbi:MAG: EAL domain-containing protein [Gammaproteobacteria bacterium]|nr:EAL domain-containing protein [Gammaproteobacteria bacterium]